MSSKRDLVEAHAFSRRRLVTAFTSGAPGGREVEPARPGRAVVAGLALGVLLLAGAALASIFAGRSPADWKDPGIVISQENGNHYVVLAEGEPLQPVLNPVSARLLMGQVEAKSVRQEDISKEPLGPRIGIYDAPTNLAGPELIRNTGWTGCTTATGATRIHIGDHPRASALAEGAFLARTGEGDRATYHLVVPAGDGKGGWVRLAMGDQAAAERLISDLGLDGAVPHQVSATWLNLFPKGPDLALASFGIPAGDDPVPYADQMGSGDFRNGDLVVNENSGQVYVLGPEAPMLLDDFARAVYEVVSGFEGDPLPISGKSGNRIEALAAWPADVPRRIDAEEACAVLDAAPDRAARVVLATDPAEAESAADLPPGTVEMSVQPGYGAYVNVGQHGDATGGTPVLVDMDARRYRLGGPQGQTAELLGLSQVRPPTVPDAWTEGFGCGPELSQAAARRMPDPQAMARCD
ncbi:type VII secretion protein EccB [Nocardioides sp. AE5]|uniref:type VII secretion protein EccB n=1 Tax=Nocardioides sp. AE5 TaxID=2962573 RepID=UPI002882D2FD|nr:type VII secretion protein EccB [Nocardioides sp. AE5]MDT0200504.1 type VII secretion protein EccB [Nocardioides sp. AE5]